MVIGMVVVFICDSVMTENDNCDFACMCVVCSVHILSEFWMLLNLELGTDDHL